MTIKSSIKNQIIKSKKIIILSIIYLLPLSISFPQTKTNLQIFYSLADSAADYTLLQIPSNEKDCKLNLILGKEYSVLKNNILSRFISDGKTIEQNSNIRNNSVVVDLTIDKAEVKYGNMFRKGLFGNFYIPREISLSGNFIVLNSRAGMRKFNYAYSDSVNVDKIKSLENISFPFTHGKLPPEPFFTSLFEPVIAIGATALAVILFFTIRSK